MDDLYKRFGLTFDHDDEVKRFRVKLSNLFESSQFGQEVFDDKDDDLAWRFANFFGKHYTHPYNTSNKVSFILPADLSFNEFLLRIQIILDLLWVTRPDISKRLGYSLSTFLSESAIDLGYFVKIYKTKSPQILPASNKRLQKKIVSAINQLETRPVKYSAAIEHFDEGLKELLAAKTKAQLKDVVEDMSTTCDSLAKAVFGDENLGFRHFFKDKRWEALKFSAAQKRIFSDLNTLIDQIKHDVIKTYTKEDIETIVYLVSTFIERVAK